MDHLENTIQPNVENKIEEQAEIHTNKISIKPVTYKKVATEIRPNIKSNKIQGPDLITNNCQIQLTFLFNASFTLQYLPRL